MVIKSILKNRACKKLKKEEAFLNSIGDLPQYKQNPKLNKMLNEKLSSNFKKMRKRGCKL